MIKRLEHKTHNVINCKSMTTKPALVKLHHQKRSSQSRKRSEEFASLNDTKNNVHLDVVSSKKLRYDMAAAATEKSISANSHLDLDCENQSADIVANKNDQDIHRLPHKVPVDKDAEEDWDEDCRQQTSQKTKKQHSQPQRVSRFQSKSNLLRNLDLIGDSFEIGSHKESKQSLSVANAFTPSLLSNVRCGDSGTVNGKPAAMSSRSNSVESVCVVQRKNSFSRNEVVNNSDRVDKQPPLVPYEIDAEADSETDTELVSQQQSPEKLEESENAQSDVLAKHVYKPALFCASPPGIDVKAQILKYRSDFHKTSAEGLNLECSKFNSDKARKKSDIARTFVTKERDRLLNKAMYAHHDFVQDPLSIPLPDVGKNKHTSSKSANGVYRKDTNLNDSKPLKRSPDEAVINMHSHNQQSDLVIDEQYTVNNDQRGEHFNKNSGSKTFSDTVVISVEQTAAQKNTNNHSSVNAISNTGVINSQVSAHQVGSPADASNYITAVFPTEVDIKQIPLPDGPMHRTVKSDLDQVTVVSNPAFGDTAPTNVKTPPGFPASYQPNPDEVFKNMYLIKMGEESEELSVDAYPKASSGNSNYLNSVNSTLDMGVDYTHNLENMSREYQFQESFLNSGKESDYSVTQLAWQHFIQTDMQLCPSPRWLPPGFSEGGYPVVPGSSSRASSSDPNNNSSYFMNSSNTESERNTPGSVTSCTSYIAPGASPHTYSTTPQHSYNDPSYLKSNASFDFFENTPQTNYWYPYRSCPPQMSNEFKDVTPTACSFISPSNHYVAVSRSDGSFYPSPQKNCLHRSSPRRRLSISSKNDTFHQNVTSNAQAAKFASSYLAAPRQDQNGSFCSSSNVSLETVEKNTHRNHVKLQRRNLPLMQNSRSCHVVTSNSPVQFPRGTTSRKSSFCSRSSEAPLEHLDLSIRSDYQPSGKPHRLNLNRAYNGYQESRSPYGQRRYSTGSVTNGQVTNMFSLQCKEPFIDSHCHIDFLMNRIGCSNFQTFKNNNRSTFPKNYEGCVTVFCDPLTFKNRQMWAQHLDDHSVWGAFGCHPHHASNYSVEAEKALKEALQHPRVVALGEIGLDYSNRNNCDKTTQVKVFRSQLIVALEHELPIIIHCRMASEDCLRILKEIVPTDTKIHRHCFTGDWNEAQEWMEAFPNLFIGITPVVTYYSATSVRHVVKELPLDRLLIETDAPYFLPARVDKLTRWSHPGMAIHTAAEIAELREDTIDEVIAASRKNTKVMYGI